MELHLASPSYKEEENQRSNKSREWNKMDRERRFYMIDLDV